jgi:hypothetical protein
VSFIFSEDFIFFFQHTIMKEATLLCL